MKQQGCRICKLQPWQGSNITIQGYIHTSSTEFLYVETYIQSVHAFLSVYPWISRSFTKLKGLFASALLKDCINSVLFLSFFDCSSSLSNLFLHGFKFFQLSQKYWNIRRLKRCCLRALWMSSRSRIRVLTRPKFLIFSDGMLVFVLWKLKFSTCKCGICAKV